MLRSCKLSLQVPSEWKLLGNIFEMILDGQFIVSKTKHSTPNYNSITKGEHARVSFCELKVGCFQPVLFKWKNCHFHIVIHDKIAGRLYTILHTFNERILAENLRWRPQNISIDFEYLCWDWEERIRQTLFWQIFFPKTRKTLTKPKL